MRQDVLAILFIYFSLHSKLVCETWLISGIRIIPTYLIKPSGWLILRHVHQKRSISLVRFTLFLARSTVYVLYRLVLLNWVWWGHFQSEKPAEMWCFDTRSFDPRTGNHVTFTDSFILICLDFLCAFGEIERSYLRFFDVAYCSLEDVLRYAFSSY